MGCDLDDMVPELGLDQVAQFPGTKRKSRILECLNHLAALEETQIAALFLTRADGVPACELREISPTLELAEHVLRLGLLCRFLRGRVLGLEADQDVARFHTFGLLKPLYVIIVVRCDFVIGHFRNITVLRQEFLNPECGAHLLTESLLRHSEHRNSLGIGFIRTCLLSDLRHPRIQLTLCNLNALLFDGLVEQHPADDIVYRLLPDNVLHPRHLLGVHSPSELLHELAFRFGDLLIGDHLAIDLSHHSLISSHLRLFPGTTGLCRLTLTGFLFGTACKEPQHNDRTQCSNRRYTHDSQTSVVAAETKRAPAR